jgi:hypothetical protein
MAYDTIYFQNPNTNQLREAPVGFSWTCFFFGCFPPLFRGDWKWGVIMFLCAVVTIGFSQLIFMFIYNKLYIKNLINEGYKVKSITKGSTDSISLKLGINLEHI